MSKKLEWKLPPTKAESVEKRLEEIIENRSITRYVIVFEGEDYWRYYPLNAEVRLYPDGVEMVFKEEGKPTGMLHFERRRIVINYDLAKEHEMQKSKIKEE